VSFGITAAASVNSAPHVTAVKHRLRAPSTRVRPLFEVGLTCGVVEILVQPGDDAHCPELSDVLSASTGGTPVALAQVISGRAVLPTSLPPLDRTDEVRRPFG
jgi:hypothetical protein